ncbi:MULTISPECIES: type II 3-dehydroquinate dehydratase [Serratia]|jgi:3-dehydroquinate dehydratase-2|uniref:3-dehydroquinate dehydratase n=1 Tax=Serratia oryzae TaxID=2034155 RepID=A0A1S8CJM3_9GAMM|nr:type II 3-dehydroquinate dehydratase [Serratia oryzae]OMQ23556.1 type II 3-dehydroquinate dehydratase [Serratia oryzae]VXD02761.1 3-dehydroquinate dehydratase, type II [Enterobacterales bacterium 8AC]
MADKFHILLLNGPNLNLLGTREPEKYGSTTLPEIVNGLENQALALNITLSHLQSNAEYALIDRIHQARGNTDFILINPAAFTHTSVALRDALLAVQIPFIEIHLSNVHAREPFRHHSYLSDIAVGVICGLGADGYTFALQAAVRRLSKSNCTLNSSSCRKATTQ